jgi:hypothetical protein
LSLERKKKEEEKTGSTSIFLIQNDDPFSFARLPFSLRCARGQVARIAPTARPGSATVPCARGRDRVLSGRALASFTQSMALCAAAAPAGRSPRARPGPGGACLTRSIRPSGAGRGPARVTVARGSRYSVSALGDDWPGLSRCLACPYERAGGRTMLIQPLLVLAACPSRSTSSNTQTQ